MVYQTETLEEIYVKPQLNPGNLVRQSQHYSYLISCLSPVHHEIQKLHCPWRPFSINVIIHCRCGEQIRANQSWQFVRHFCWAEGVTQGASDRVSPQTGNTQKIIIYIYIYQCVFLLLSVNLTREHENRNHDLSTCSEPRHARRQNALINQADKWASLSLRWSFTATARCCTHALWGKALS